MDVRCNLIVDSSCDLPPAVVNRPGVELVSLSYLDTDGEHLDDLWQSESMHAFYDRMRGGSCPTTSRVSPACMREAFERAAANGLPTVCLCMSSSLSSTYEGACAAREDVIATNKSADIRIVDTRLASTGQAVLVYEVLRMRDEGFSADEIEQWANEARYSVQTYFMVDSLDALQRGGRIPKGVAVAGSMLNVKPVLAFDLDGRLVIAGVARGRKKGLQVLADKYNKLVDRMRPSVFFMGHADCEEDMLSLREMLSTDGSATQVVSQPIGPVIGSHVGPGMVSLAFWGPDRREK